MFTKTVEVGALRLTSEQDKLQLSISTSAEFQLPDRLSTTVNKELIRALTSGGVWASHGAQCRLDIVLSIDGKVVQDSQSFHLIEAIAYRLRNAPMWNQLALLSSVDVQHPSSVYSLDLTNEKTSHVSIALSRGQKHEDGSTTSEVDADINVHPPESVWCAKFVGLRVQFNFSTIRVHDAESKSLPMILPVTPLRQDILPNQQTSSGYSPRSTPGTQASGNSKEGLPKSKNWTTSAPKTPLSKEIVSLDGPVSSRQKKRPAPKTPLSNDIMSPDEPDKFKKRTTILPKTPLSKEIMLLEETPDSEDVTPNVPASILDSSLPSKTLDSSDISQKSKTAPVKKQGKRKARVSSPDPFIKQEVVEASVADPLILPSYKRQKASPDTPTKAVSKVQGKKGSAVARTAQNHGILRTWVEQNRKDPYPTKAQMQSLLIDTGYTRGHMITLLKNIRTSVLAAVIKIEPDLTPPPEIASNSQPKPSMFKLAMNLGLENEMLLDESDDAPYDIENDNMLLDPVDESLPWFDSRSLSSSPTSGSFSYGIKSLASDHEVVNLTSSISIPIACQLTETALRFLVGGVQRIRRGIKASPARPEFSLSLLIPSLFDLGFKKLMAQNARFIPTITAAICVTLVKNKQSAELRKKLFLLGFAAKELDAPDNAPATQRKMKMQDVVQRRIWSMMHRKLQDTHRARNLRHTISDGVKNRPFFEDDEDLFAGLHADYDSQDSQASQDSQDSQLTIFDSDDGGGEFMGLLDDEMESENVGNYRNSDLFHGSSSLIFDDEEEDFDDIFLSGDHDDEGLLSYLDEMEVDRERREIERETEVMLLENYPDNNDMLLEEPFYTAEEMLLDSYFEGLPLTIEEVDEKNVASFARTRGMVEAPLGVGWR